MLTFAAAVLLLIATPGPGVLSTAGVGAAFGFRAGLGYVVGLLAGNAAVAAAVISGLAAVVLAVPSVRWVLGAASVLYLLWLAWRIATAGSRIAIVPATKAPGLRDGLALQAINPKAYAVNTALFTGFAISDLPFVAEVIAKLLIFNAIWIPIHLGWLWAGVTLHRMDLAPRTQAIINAAMAAAMLGVVALALAAAV